MADAPDTITIAPGSTTVTGYLTQFMASEGDLFLAGGFIGEVASRISNTELRLKLPWAGPLLTGVRYGLIDIGPYLRQTFTLNRTVIDLIRRFDIAAPFKFDAYGTTDQRGAYNGQAKGFVYLAIDGVRARMFLKLKNTNDSSDWSPPIAIGTGDQVDFENALVYKLDTNGDGGAVTIAPPFADAQAYALSERAGDEVSVMSFIPKSLRAAIRSGTSNADVTSYVRKAMATGKRIYFPTGRYRVTDKLTYAPGQTLYGDGVIVSVIVIDAGFNMAASSVFEALGSDSSGWDNIGIEFDQSGATSRATLRKYPWALDIRAATRFKIGRFRLSGAWNGIWGEGNCGGLHIVFAEIGAFNKGMILDGLLDFAHLGILHFWPWSFASNVILMSIYLDGETIGLEVGVVDGLNAQSICTFGPLILSNANGNDGAARQIGMMQLDGDNSRFINYSGDWQIGILSTTKSGNKGVAVVVSTAGFVTVAAMRTWGNNGAPFLSVEGGVFSVTGGSFEMNGDHTAIEVTGGRLNLSNTTLFPLVGSAGPARTAPFVRQEGAGVLVATGNVAAYSADGGGGALFQISNVSADHVVCDNAMAGWGIALPDGQIVGSYDGNLRPAAPYVKGIAVGREFSKRLTGVLNSSGEIAIPHGVIFEGGATPAERIFAITASAFVPGQAHYPYPLSNGSAWDGGSVYLKQPGPGYGGLSFEITVRYR